MGKLTVARVKSIASPGLHGGDTVAGRAEWRSLALGSDTCVNGRAGVSAAPAADKRALAAGAPIRRDVWGCTLGSMLVTAVGTAAFDLPDPAAQTQPPVPPRTGIGPGKRSRAGLTRTIRGEVIGMGNR